MSVTYDRKTEHVEEGLDNRSTAHHLTSMAKLMVPLLEEVQVAEDLAWQVLESRFISLASGHSLDLLGGLVGEGDIGDTDDAQKLRIALKLAVYRSKKGRRKDYNRIFALLEGSIWGIFEYPGWAVFVQNGDKLYDSATLFRLLDSASGDGFWVRALFNESAEEPFKWGSSDGTIAGGEWDSSDGTTVGNDFQGVRLTPQ